MGESRSFSPYAIVLVHEIIKLAVFTTLELRPYCSLVQKCGAVVSTCIAVTGDDQKHG